MVMVYRPTVSGEGRVVRTAQWNALMKRFRRDGVLTDDYGATSLQVSADGSGMQVTVAAGEALMLGGLWTSDADEPLIIEAADGTYDRIDLVVARFDRVTETASLAVLKGVPAATPVPKTPTRNASVWEIELARIHVSAGVTSINAGDVEDRRTRSDVIPHLHPAPYAGGERIINVAAGDDPQVVMDLADHYIRPGETVKIVLANGVFTFSKSLYVRGWYGAGELIITSAAGDETLHDDQPVTLDFSGAASSGLTVIDCTVPVRIVDLRIVVDTANVNNHAISVYDGKAEIVGCYVEGSGVDYGMGIFIGDAVAVVKSCYVSNVEFGVYV